MRPRVIYGQQPQAATEMGMHAHRSHTRPWGKITAGLAIALAVLAACGSSGGKSSSKTTTPGSTAAQSTAAGIGVTPTTIKIGVALVNFDCIKQFTDQLRINQDKAYQAFFDDLNAKGGIAGRKIVPVYKTYCPLGSAAPLQVCTSLTQDEKVFAVIGTFIDFSGDAQTCVANTNHTILMTFNLTKQIMDKSPPGYIIYPGVTNERLVNVLLQLAKKEKTLDGKTVAAVGDTTVANTVSNVIVPGLKNLGVKLGSTAILSVGTSGDTTQAQTQLDSFIERWKTEGVNALFMSGDLVSSKQFVEKIKREMPDVQLLVDTTDALMQGQQETLAHVKPNPYDGMLTATGPTHHEYDQSAHWKYCAAIYEKYTKQHAPNAEEVVRAPGGKTYDTYGLINDACQITSLFHDIGTKVGKYLNNPNWVNTVNTFGKVDNKGGGQYASLHTGKYDIDDSFRLVAFDSTLAPATGGDWKPLTPVENIPGV
jgi:ABC-type branched-subunit amino acid transport system substrate-binding protein